MQRFMQRFADRAAEVRQHGSPTYIHTFGIILAGEEESIGLATVFPTSKKYEPLDRVFIVNTSGELCRVIINGSPYTVLPPNSTMLISDQAIWSFSIKNLHASVATVSGELIATFDKGALDADKLTREQYG